MSIRNTMFAFAAFASLVGAALAPTSASAFGGHGGHGGHGGFGFHGGHGPVVNHGGRYHFDHRFPIWDRYHFQHRFPIWGSYRNWPRWGYERYDWRRWNYRYDSRRFHRPIVKGELGVGGGASAMVASASMPSTGPGNCLTKQYAPDGTVVFKDMCTREEGVGAPNGPMSQGPGPQ